MKILIAYYSRSKNTEKIAQVISENLKADLDEIIDFKNRKGVIRFIISGFDAYKKRLTKIKYDKDPSKYNLVLIGGPVWAGTISCAIRTYLSENKFKKIAFFCSYNGRQGKIFLEMEKLSKKPVAVLGLKAKEINEDKIREFCEKIKKA